MRTRLLLVPAILLALVGGPAGAADPSPLPRTYTPPGCATPPYHLPPGYPQPQPPGALPADPGRAPDAPPPEQPALPQDAFAQAPEAGTQAGEGFNPNMFGDLVGPTTVVRLNGRNGSTVTARVFTAPVASRGAFKIADNESPRPLDRVFVTYNFFGDVLGPLEGPGIPSTNLHREVIGFEKTLLSGNASFGMRLPFLQITGLSEIEDSFVGDLTFIGKYAFINNRQTGNVLSGGMTVTAPTGENNILLGPVQSTLLQAWGGFIYNMGNFYAHGFSSIMVPTDARDATIMFNDLGLGAWLYRSNNPNQLVSAIVPTGEVHVNTPLNNGEGFHGGGFDFIDSVNLTGGVYWVLRQRLFIGTAVGFPVTGPRPFDIEAIVNANLRF